MKALSWWGKVALCGVLALCAIAIFAPYIAPYAPDMQDLSSQLVSSSGEHILGTDYLGRDIFSRLVYGARLSLGCTLVIIAWIVALGICVGGLCGFVGGRLDSLCIRVCDIFMSVPTIALSLFMVGILGAGLENVMLAIVLTHWAWYARIVRGIVYTLRHKEYVLLSYMFGASGFARFKRHIFTPIATQCLVLASMDIGHIMLHIAGLSFLGLGVQPPDSEWGVMISEAKDYMWDYPHLMLYPGLALFISVALCNLLGESLRDSFGTKVQLKDMAVKPSSAPLKKMDSLSLAHFSLMNLHSQTLLLDSVELCLKRGECVALLGRSGSGKSLIGHALQGFIASNIARVSGEVRLGGASINPALYRGRAFISIMQNPRTCFNPLLSIHHHCKESLRALHKPYDKAFIIECLRQVGLDSSHLKAYPFELSGGMLQRAMIAIALLTQAPFLIADEPTSDLDNDVAHEILTLLKRLQQERALGILLITHDLEIAAEYAEYVSVIAGGKIIERARVIRGAGLRVQDMTGDYTNKPQSPTLKLMETLMAKGAKEAGGTKGIEEAEGEACHLAYSRHLTHSSHFAHSGGGGLC